MANEENKGIGFCTLLQVAFIVLKVINAIDWSWWMVLLPFEIAFVLLIIGTIIYLLLRRSL